MIKELREKLNTATELLKNLEDGDLISIAIIEEAINEIGRCNEIFNIKNMEKLSKRVLKLFRLREKDSKIPGMIQEVLSLIINLFDEDEDRRREVLEKINLLIPSMNSVLKSCLLSSMNYKQKKDYPEDYFNNITTDTNMLKDFVVESLEHLERAQIDIVDLEYDTANVDKIDSVFRAFHSIKGSSSFLGLRNIEEVAHSLEGLFSMVKDSKIRATKEIIDRILEGIELLKNLLNIITINNFDVEKIKLDYKNVYIYDYISEISSITGHKKIGEILKEDGKINEEDIQEILIEQIESKKKFGEIAVEKEKVKEEDVELAFSKQQHELRKFVSSYVKVSHEKLNELVDNVGELVINQSMIKQKLLNMIKDVELERVLNALEQIIKNMKNIVISMGMVPIEEIFNKLKVVIRNTSKDIGKIVNVEFYGEDTELDKNVIEKIYDPLVHIVRNAIDHGIEKPDEREKKGKKRAGLLEISAYHKGNNIEIVIKDDGQGIRKDKVIKKAKEKGLIAKEDGLSDKDIYNLIFLPGFSTKESVTNISGRGVGLDVVKKNIDEIKGKIEIESKKDEYTKITIKIPLTLAIIEGFITKIGTNIYIFPFDIIEQIITVNNNDFTKTSDGDYMIYHNGRHIPVIVSGKILNEQNYKNDIRDFIIIIIEYDNIPYGIAVDNVIGKQETVIKSLGGLFSDNSVFSGGTIFGDGTIGFVIDIDKFIEKAKGEITVE